MTDRAKRWRIRERQAPSWQPAHRVYGAYARTIGAVYQDVLRRALRDARARVRADAEDTTVSATEAALLRSAMAAALVRAARRAARVPIPRAALGGAFRTAAEQAARAERAYLVGMGADPGRLASRLAVPVDRMLTVDIALTAGDAAVLESSVREGLDLVTRIGKEQLQGYETWLAEAIREGRRWESIQGDLVDRYGIDRRHAEVIARDQVGKVNGKIAERTQQAAGVARYVWRATSDSRTRDSHRAVDGYVWAWSSPPPGTGPYGEAAHPGQAIQCRCGAEPVVPDDLRVDFGLSGPAPQVGDRVPL